MERDFFDKNQDTSQGKQVFLSKDVITPNDYHSDEELWRAFKEGSRIALKEIYERHVDLLYNYGRKITKNCTLIEDKVQDLFVELWIRKATLGNVKNIKAYLLISFRNKVIDAIKKSKHEVAFENADSMEVLLTRSASQQLSEDKIEALTISLNKLSAQKREAIFLRFYNNLSCAEIAEIMKIKTQSVYNLISTGLMVIKDTLKGID